MKAFFEHAAKQLLVLLVSAPLAFAQTPPAPRNAAATQQELDQMLAPITDSRINSPLNPGFAPQSRA